MANLLALLGAKSMMAAGSVAVVATGTAIVYKDEIPKLLEKVGIVSPAPEVKPEPVALTPPDAESEPKTEVPQAAPAPEVVQPQIAAPIVPTFDVLRVEEDGSILVAGNAAPNSSVELMTADGNVIGRVKAGAEGDFVILPDNLLPPGDYVMALRAKVGAEEPVLSQQSSVVTVPEKDGEVLAMISEVGKPSRIVAKPQALEEPAVDEPVKPEPVAESPAEPAPIVEAQPEEPVKPVEEEVAVVPAPEQEAKQEQPQTAPEPEVAAKVAPEAEAVSEPVTEVVAKAEDKPDTAIAAAEPAPPPPSVVVEAVEVENGQVYVAGAIPSGVPVRIYIDNEFIGLTRGTSDDRFLVTREFDLSEGEHAVRADVIDSKTGAVLARAEVPLIHELPDAPEPEVEIAAAPPVEQPPVVENTPAVEPEPVEPVKEVTQAPKEPVQPNPQPTPEPVQATPEPVVEAKIPEAPKPPEAPKTALVEDEVKPAKVEQSEEVAQVAPRKKPMVLKTGRAVIIKRGDNLWRISRKTYGRGIRYTTIYKANQSQIRDPHRIYIGQIFKIPEHKEQEG